MMHLAMLLLVIPAAHALEYPELGVRVDVIAENLEIPWSIDWLPNGDVLFTERGGELRVIRDGQLQDEPLISQGVAGVEGGMLGVAVDPRYEENNFVYIYYTYNEFLATYNKVARYKLDGQTITEDRVLLDRIPGGPFHDGGRIQFGPDGKLYITTGDAGDPGLSQDPGSLAGKILRINPDGTIPSDNPHDSAVYSIGHRNPQGIDWDAAGNLFSTEHGPSGWRSTGHDEINLIVAGANYGWPDVIGDESGPGLTGPVLHTGAKTWAPAGSAFYYGKEIPQWSGMYFVATLLGEHLHMIELQDGRVVSDAVLFQDDFGRLRDVKAGPDGLYILTSNKDGRGFPNAGDDKILRIAPLNHTGCNAGEPIKVSTAHDADSGIIVSGCTSDLSPGEIDVQISDAAGKVVASGVVMQKDGRFQKMFDGLANGTYVASATDGRFTATSTFVVPEFGSMVVLLLAVMMVILARIYASPIASPK